MRGVDVIQDYLRLHPGERVDSEGALGRIWAWNADRLRREAHDIMDRLGLPQALSTFGDARVVGSVAAGLLVKLDIDIHVLVSDSDLYRAMDPIYRMFLDRAEVTHVRINDYRSDAGLKLGIDAYPGSSGEWSIDIMVTDRIKRTGFALAERIVREMTAEQRLTILAIKGEYYSQGLLEGGISTRIYEAVLDHGVTTTDGFRRYIGGAAGQRRGERHAPCGVQRHPREPGGA